MQGTGPSGKADTAFKEQVRKAASTVLEEESSKIQQTERPERRDRLINSSVTGLWLILLGAALAFLALGLGAAIVVGGVAAIVWALVFRSAKK